MSGALLRLIDLYEERGELDQAQTIGRRLVNLEPWNEGNHRRLIQLLVSSGKRSEALRQYQACQRILVKNSALSLPRKLRHSMSESARVTKEPLCPPSNHPQTTAFPYSQDRFCYVQGAGLGVVAEKGYPF